MIHKNETNKETEILQHRISYWFDNDKLEMNDIDIEHVAYQITEGFAEGELNQYFNEEEIRGYWKIVK